MHRAGAARGKDSEHVQRRKTDYDRQQNAIAHEEHDKGSNTYVFTVACLCLGTMVSNGALSRLRR